MTFQKAACRITLIPQSNTFFTCIHLSAKFWLAPVYYKWHFQPETQESRNRCPQLFLCKMSVCFFLRLWEKFIDDVRYFEQLHLGGLRPSVCRLNVKLWVKKLPGLHDLDFMIPYTNGKLSKSKKVIGVKKPVFFLTPSNNMMQDWNKMYP